MELDKEMYNNMSFRNENKLKPLFISFLFSSLFATLFALALKSFGVSINVIIPSAAPIWMGILTTVYMVQV